jgi:hypothetical protein
MDTVAGHRPDSWHDVDRDTLVGLLAAGLTPDEVGALYSRSGSLVRRAARG